MRIVVFLIFLVSTLIIFIRCRLLIRRFTSFIGIHSFHKLIYSLLNNIIVFSKSSPSLSAVLILTSYYIHCCCINIELLTTNLSIFLKSLVYFLSLFFISFRQLIKKLFVFFRINAFSLSYLSKFIDSLFFHTSEIRYLFCSGFIIFPLLFIFHIVLMVIL